MDWRQTTQSNCCASLMLMTDYATSEMESCGRQLNVSIECRAASSSLCTC
jgi:hypothetical protein